MGSARDEDGNNLANAADPKCAQGAAFAQLGTTGVYAAEAEDGIPAGTMVVGINDPLKPFGPDQDYLWVPTGQNPFHGQAVYTGAPAGTYEIHILTRFESPSSAELWLKVDSQPFLGPPSNADADILNNRSPVLSPTWLQLGRTGSAANYVAGIKSEPQRKLTITPGQSVYLMAQAGLQIDCMALRPIGSTHPINCPGGDRGGGTQPIADYTLKAIGPNTPTIDGMLDSFVAQANAVNYLGRPGGNQGTNTVTRLAWDDNTNRIYFWHTTTLAGLVSQGTAEDSSLIFNTTRFEFVFRLLDLQRVRDASTYKFVCNLGGFIYDRNDAGGVSNPAFDFSDRACAVTYTSNVLVIEGYLQPAENLAPGQLFLFDGAAGEEVSGTWETAWVWRCQTGTNLLPDCWGIAQLSATTMQTPPDTTAPVVSPPVCTPHETGATCVAAITEVDSFPVTCRAFRDADNNNEVTTDGSFVTSTCGSAVGGNCSCSFSGLSNRDHEMQIEATDAVGNVGVSAIADFSLTQLSGNTLFLARDGSDLNDCSSGSRCLTLPGAMSKAVFGPGVTVLVGNGTHVNTFMINCANNPEKFNGTQSARITLWAESALRAHIIPADPTLSPLEFLNCSFWTVENFYFKGQNSTASDAMSSVASFRGSGNNNIFRGNVLAHPNKCRNSVVFRVEDVTDSLIEENHFLDFHRNGVGAGARNIYRRNFIHSRNAATPACGVATTGSQDPTRGDSGMIIYASQTNLDMLFENNIVEDTSGPFTTTGGIKHKRIRFYGNIARLSGAAGFHEETRQAGFKEDNYYEHNLSLGHRSTGFRARGSVGVIYKNNSAFAIDLGLGLGKPGFSGDVTIDGWGNQNYSWTFIQNLALFHAGTGMSIEHPVSNGRMGNMSNWELRKNNAFGNNSNYNPTSGGTITDPNGTSTGVFTGNTSIDPKLGDALICIPTNSSMHPSQRTDGLQIGASVLYRYESPTALQPGNLTTSKLWSTSKGAGSNCPNSSNGWYPSWLQPCITGVTDIPGTSLYDVADRVISRNPKTATSVLNSCVPNGSY